jgi:hypothetical protein
VIWLTLYLSFYLPLTLFAASCFGLAQLLGAQVRAVRIGAGPSFRFQVGTTELTLGALPVSSWAEPRGRAKPEEGNWWQLSLARRLAITVGPFAAYAAVALLLLGPTRAGASIAHGFHQIFVQLDLTGTVRAFLALARSAPLTVIVGVLLAKVFVANAATAVGAVAHELGRRWPAVILYFASGLWISGRLIWGFFHALFI